MKVYILLLSAFWDGGPMGIYRTREAAERAAEQDAGRSLKWEKLPPTDGDVACWVANMRVSGGYPYGDYYIEEWSVLG